MRLGLVSDTHGLLRPEVLDAMRGVARILHAGDVGDPAVLDALARVAPVDAVRGNNDRGSWAETLPAERRLRFGGVEVLLVHDAADARPEGARVVVVGHSHRPRVEERDGVLWVNPGSAGPRRFTLPIAAGYLVVEGDRVEAEIRTLG